ncbi:hypothetical protein P154DRAFT_568924 [Amniculicola lignicola CBS 123094]|uniref:RING-type domain-containing protein n=1 Tax=Amniculicola lignicola CBS 123094 TaxID=1392246 RepID=A0A6A5X563_9PLEO|nr:hypothetical protein P154DRAFT_568924 [Amniculicola lignicola CBS 123094]
MSDREAPAQQTTFSAAGVAPLDQDAIFANGGSAVGVFAALSSYVRARAFDSADEAALRAREDFWPIVCRSQDITDFARTLLIPVDVENCARYLWLHQSPNAQPNPLVPEPVLMRLWEPILRHIHEEDCHTIHDIGFQIRECLLNDFEEAFPWLIDMTPMPPDSPVLEPVLPLNVDKISEVLECEICLAPVDNPVRVNVCQHIFCRGCLQHWIEDGEGGTRMCPKCRRPLG